MAAVGRRVVMAAAVQGAVMAAVGQRAVMAAAGRRPAAAPERARSPIAHDDHSALTTTTSQPRRLSPHEPARASTRTIMTRTARWLALASCLVAYLSSSGAAAPFQDAL